MEERPITPDPQIPAALSFRELAVLLQQAPAEPAGKGSEENAASAERQALEALLAEWSRSSQRLLAALGRGGSAVTQGRSPRQLMALGALQAHLAMGLQAHAAATGPQNG